MRHVLGTKLFIGVPELSVDLPYMVFVVRQNNDNSRIGNDHATHVTHR